MGWRVQRTLVLFSSDPEHKVVKAFAHHQLIAIAISPGNSFCNFAM